MRDYEPTSHQENLPSDPDSAKTSGPPAVEDLQGAASASPLPPASSLGWPVSARMSEQWSRPKIATTTVEDEARFDRGRCADGFGNGTVRRAQYVVIRRGRAICGRQQLAWTFWIRRTGFQCPIWTGRGRVVGHGRERSQVELHADDVSGPGGNSRRGVFDEVREGDDLDLEERHFQRRTRPRTGERRFNDHQGH